VRAAITECETFLSQTYKPRRRETSQRRAVREALSLIDTYGSFGDDEAKEAQRVETLAATLLNDPSANLYRDRLEIIKQHPELWPFVHAHEQHPRA
jgi:hypothetical protein